MTKLLALPPHLTDLSLGLDPLSKDLFNESISKLQARRSMSEAQEPHMLLYLGSRCGDAKGPRDSAMYYDFDWKDAPLSSRSLPVVTGVLYLLMVFIIPRFVPPGGYKLDKVLVAHNFILSAMSLILCVGCAWEMIQRVQNESGEWMFCESPATPARGPLYFWSYAFYVSKYYELFDTLLALLRASRQLPESKAKKAKLCDLFYLEVSFVCSGKEEMRPLATLLSQLGPRPYAQTDAMVEYGFLDPPGVDSAAC
eukprot:Skav228012  [mRNA]  locus=scaffold1073:37465:53785:+ [translate_table: standard]